MKAVQDVNKQITSDRNAFAFAKAKAVWTWGRLTYEVNRLAGGLVELEIQPDDRVALHRGNLPELPVAYLTCFQVGAIAAPLNIKLNEVGAGLPLTTSLGSSVKVSL